MNLAEHLDQFYLETQKERSNVHNLQALRQRHFDIIRMHIEGLSDNEIADILEVSLPTVRYTLNSEMAKNRIAEINAWMDEEAITVKKRLEEAAPLALDILLQILISEDEKSSNKIRAANSLLDRAGHAPPRSGGSNASQINIINLRDRLLNAKAEIVVSREEDDTPV